MGREPPLTVILMDRIGELRTRLRAMGLEEMAADLTALAEQIDEAQLNAASMLRYGELRPRRLRRMREITQRLRAA